MFYHSDLTSLFVHETCQAMMSICKTGSQLASAFSRDISSDSAVMAAKLTRCLRHILMNNAGIMANPFSLTVDKLESQFATNHLGHFLLTKLLLPELEVMVPQLLLRLQASHRRCGLLSALPVAGIRAIACRDCDLCRGPLSRNDGQVGNATWTNQLETDRTTLRHRWTARC